MNADERAAFNEQTKSEIAHTFKVEQLYDDILEQVREVDFQLRVEAGDVHDSFGKDLHTLEQHCLDTKVKLRHDLAEWNRNFPTEYASVVSRLEQYI